MEKLNGFKNYINKLRFTLYNYLRKYINDKNYY